MTVTGEITRTRLLAAAVGGLGSDLASHLSVHGPLPASTWHRRHREPLLAEVSRSGLTGRGGAGFPTARKIEMLARQPGRPVLLVNAMEGEPASAKDRVLLDRTPHLVLDGAQVAATLIGAKSVALCVAADHDASAASLGRALDERVAAGSDPVGVELLRAPGRYAAGEESALVDWVAGGRGLPTFRPDKTIPLSAGRRPALVQNAETVAQLALVARHGAAWFRSAGLPDAPGTTLVTVSGAVPAPGVLEVELGTPLCSVLERAGSQEEPKAVLLGGYGGAWLAGSALDVTDAPGPLAGLGATIGAGVIGVLPHGACGLAETASIVAYLAGQSAGQCGPCTFGLPALADDLARLAHGLGDSGLLERLGRRLGEVEGRGACRLPDGAVHLVRSALEVFAEDVRAHASHSPCPGWRHPPVLPLPRRAPELGNTRGPGRPW